MNSSNLTVLPDCSIAQGNSMKRAAHSCTLAIVFVCLVLLLPLSSFAQSEAALPMLQIGDSLERIRLRTQFLLDAAEGQTVSLRWEGTHLPANCQVPLEDLIDVVTVVTNAGGEEVESVGLLYTPVAPTQVFFLEGPGPYHAAAEICGGAQMTVTLLEGDVISRVEQPPLTIDQSVEVSAASIGPDQLLAFPLNVQVGDVFTVRSRFMNRSRGDDFPMTAAVVRDANGHIVPSDFSHRLPAAYIASAAVYTVDGNLPYRLEFPALELYSVSYSERFGDTPRETISYTVELQRGNTAIVDAGVLTPGTAVQGTMRRGVPVFYTLDVAQGESFTFIREYAQTPGQYFLNADGDLADNVTSFVNQAGGQTWIMSLNGPSPYIYYLQGEGSYSLRLETGSAIEGNEVGRLAPGDVLHVTIPPVDERLDYLTLDVNPEATITLNWSVAQTEFRIRDGAGNPLYPRNDYWTDGYAVVDLSQGTPPFVVSLDDARYAGQTFTFTLAEGETPLSP